MKQYISSALLAIMFCPVSFSQNLVPNHSFELNDVLHPNAPTGIAEIEHMQDWKNFNTSDWISDESGYYNEEYDPTGPSSGGSGSTMTAHTGHNFIGFGPCEGAQVKLTQQTEKFQWVTFSFWFSPRGKCDTKINAYLLKNNAPNGALSDCDNPNITFELHQEIVVNADGTDAVHIPGTWYHYQSDPVLVTDDEYEWFAIKGDNTAGYITSNNYIFVDDVEVTAFDFCDNICVNSTGDVDIDPEPPQNAMIGNYGLNFFCTFENANQVEFRVFDRWGCMVYESVNYDANGLIDVGYPDFAIVWNGNMTPIGCNSNSTDDVDIGEIYDIKIDAYSCNWADYHYIGTLYVADIYNPPGVPYGSTQNKTIQNCCPDHIYHQNQTFNSQFREDMNDFIEAGYNVTGNPTYGNVEVLSTADVRFIAGDYIHLAAGFNVHNGADFQATIAPCGAIPKNLQQRNTARDYYEDLRRNGMQMPVKGINVYPNPSEGPVTLNIGGFKDGTYSLALYDMTGTVVYSANGSTAAMQLDFGQFAAGTYMLSVIYNGEVYTQRLILQ